ncbi:ABC transporter permease subunit [Virgibacillus sp. MG-45]|uniref:ABC transporter permease subunit n=1 Tax=Virgibacillus sp. MG-45 TaxID=3102791 RepID=UPI002ED9932A
MQRIRTSLSFFIIVFFILMLAAIPLALNTTSGKLMIDFHVVSRLINTYISGIGTGDTFIYQEGIDRSPNYLQTVGRHFSLSFVYLLVAGLTAVIIGMIVASWYSRSKKEWSKDIIGFLGLIPDFIFILFLQLGVVWVYQSTGFHIARVASRGADEHALLLPLITLIIVPTIYLIRTLSEATAYVLTEDYILTAKAKGFSVFYIFMQHAVRNILPYLKADLHKVIAIMMSNLFIVEYLFNISGLTSLLFTKDGYQYNLTVNTLLTMVIMYVLLYWSIRLFIVILERIFSYE